MVGGQPTRRRSAVPVGRQRRVDPQSIDATVRPVVETGGRDELGEQPVEASRRVVLDVRVDSGDERTQLRGEGACAAERLRALSEDPGQCVLRRGAAQRLGEVTEHICRVHQGPLQLDLAHRECVERRVQVDDKRTKIGVLAGEVAADRVEFEVERVQLRRPRGQHVSDGDGVEGQRIGVIDGLVEVSRAGAAECEHALLQLRAN